MDRLSSLDAGFLYMETPETPMNVGSVTLFAPTTVPIDKIFHDFRAHTVARLDLLPSYRRRLQQTPMSIDHPVWVLEEQLDLDHHIQRRTLPQPGTLDQLRELIGALHMIPLDRTKPLWEYYLIEGLQDFGFAIYVKVHHAAMDGVSGMATLPVIYDLSAEPAPVPAPKANPALGEKPGFAELLAGAVSGFLNQELRVLTTGPKLAAALVKAGRRAVSTLQLLPKVVRLPPRTLFNVSISEERSYGTASIALSETIRIAKARHATVNDVVLAVCAGALCRYLGARRELPEEPLVAAVPVSVREPGHTEMNNQVAVVLCSLATDIANPLERLSAIAASSRDSKDRFADVKDIWPSDISVPGAPLLVAGLARFIGTMHVFDVLPNMANMWISNIPGPRKPFYCAGIPAVHYYPVSIPYHGAALEFTAQGYLDNIEFGLTACGATVPDVQVIADYLVEALAVLGHATDAADRPGRIEVIDLTAPAPLISVDQQALPQQSRANVAETDHH